MSSSGGGTEEGRATGLWEVDLIRLGDGLGRAVAREGQRPPARVPAAHAGGDRATCRGGRRVTAGWGEARRCSRLRWVRETRRKSGGCVGRTAGCAGLASRGREQWWGLTSGSREDGSGRLGREERGELQPLKWGARCRSGGDGETGKKNRSPRNGRTTSIHCVWRHRGRGA